MREKTGLILSAIHSIKYNPLDLVNIQDQLRTILPLVANYWEIGEHWEKPFVQRIIDAKTITDIFTSFFQIASPHCFEAGGYSDKVIKPLFIACAKLDQRPDDFYEKIYHDRFRKDKTWLPQILTTLSPWEVDSIFKNASNVEIRQLLGYIKDYLNNKEALGNFLMPLLKDSWLRCLRYLYLEDLSALNLAAIAKESGALRQALAEWLKENWHERFEEFWNFIENQRLISIPGVSDLLMANSQESVSDFWSAFLKRNKDQDQDLYLSFLMPNTLNNNASFPFCSLSTHDQLLAYGLLSIHLAQKQELSKASSRVDNPAAIELSSVEQARNEYFKLSPSLRLLHQQQAFPTNLIPVLARHLSLSDAKIKEYLYAAGCLAEPVFTIEDWVKRYRKGVIITTGKKLIIEKQSLNIEEIKALAKALKTDTTLRIISLKDSKINDEAAKVLTDALKTNNSLTTLDLSCDSFRLGGSDLGSEGVKALTEMLETNTGLTTLYLNGNSIGNSGAKALAKALKINASVRILDLTMNFIGSEGAEALAETLKINASLRTLKLSGNHIHNKGIQALAEALEINASLIVLDAACGSHGPNDVSAKALAKTLKINTSLKKLHLGGSVGCEGAKALAEALETNASLEELDLSWNFIGNNGLKALTQALKTNTSLTKLNIEYNSVKDKGFEALAEALEINTSLRDLGESIESDWRSKKEVKDLVKSRIERNQRYYQSHLRIKQHLQQVKKALSDEESSSEDVQALLTTALDEARKLCEATPCYWYAEMLLHEVLQQAAFAYAGDGNYLALIELYFEHFISHPDDRVSLELAGLLVWIEDDAYEAAKLNSKIDRQQLVLSLLAGNKEPQADIYRSQALYVLKGNKGMTEDTFATIAGVGKNAAIITFAELTALTERLKLKKQMQADEGQIRIEDERNTLRQSTEEDENVEPELMRQIKAGEAQVYVYEQLIMEPNKSPKPVEFNKERVVNQDEFEPYAERAKILKNTFLASLFPELIQTKLTAAIQENYGEKLDVFSAWHSRTLTARRLAGLSPDLSVEQLRRILQIELNAKRREIGSEERRKSHSLFPCLQKKNLVDMLEEALQHFPPVDDVDDDSLRSKKELAELLLSWVDTEERSLGYKLFHKPDVENDNLAKRIKTVGDLAHEILLCDAETLEKLLAFETRIQQLNLDDESQKIINEKFSMCKKSGNSLQFF